MLRLLLPLVLLLLAFFWIAHVYFIKKEKKQAKNILSITLFFTVVWSGIYYFLFIN